MRGTTLILSAAVLWGTTGTAQALGPDATTPLGVGSVRIILGGSMLFAFAVIGRRSTNLRWLRHPATLVAAAGMAAYQPAFFSAVDRTGVAVGTLVTIGSGPIFVGLLETVITRRPPSRTWLLATAPALAGLITLGLSSGAAEVDTVGVAYALLAGFGYASYAVAASRLARVGPTHESAGVIFGLAAMLLLPVAAGQNLSWVVTGPGLAMTAWLGLAATAAAYLLFSAGLRTTHAGTAATLTLAEPVTATILGVVVLSERPDAAAWLGVVLIGLGLILARRVPVPATRTA
ncbi:MAG: EamA family transporter [Acidimicrobiia bacterium]|nr:EamA family transporter [Acidimicrobiia bacterium]